MWKKIREETVFEHLLKKIENPSNIFLVYASFWLIGLLSYFVALTTHFWVKHQLVNGIIGDYHGLLYSCAARDITLKIDGCSSTEWSVAKVPLYMLLSRCFMIAAGIAVGIGTVGSIGLKKAFSTPPYPKQRLPSKLAGLAFFFGGVLIFVACVIFFMKANSKRDGIFVRGPDVFFGEALAIVSGETEYFHIFDFFESESGEQMTPLFSLDFDQEHKVPEVSQSFSFSFIFAWISGSLFIITGLVVFILSRRLDLESDDATLYVALTLGLVIDKSKDIRRSKLSRRRTPNFNNYKT